jgi:hypothetical protein
VWTSWATTRRLSRKRTGTSIRSAFTRCRWVLCRRRLTALVWLVRRRRPVLIRSMLEWVGLARVCRLFHIQVLCRVSPLLRQCTRLLGVKRRRVRLRMNFRMSLVSSRMSVLRSRLCSVHRSVLRNFRMSLDSSRTSVLRSLLCSLPRIAARLDRNSRTSQGSSLTAVLRLRQSSAPPTPAHRQGQDQDQRVPA